MLGIEHVRIARDAGQSRERRAQASHPPRVRPELVAHGPSEVWSWDITALKGPRKGGPYGRVGLILLLVEQRKFQR